MTMTNWNPEKLQRVSRGRPKRPPAQPLGTLVDNILQRLVYPKQKKLAQLRQAWNELLPEELLAHSRLESVYRGQLRVLVDNAASLYEFNLISGQELVGQLNKHCPGVKLSRIKFVRDRWEETR